MTETTRYTLPLLDAGQAQKEITHNEALARLDALLHLAVESRIAPAAPAATTGQAWIVAAGAAGAWSGHGGDVAIFDDAGWTFVTPPDGCIAYIRDEQTFIHRAGGGWQERWAVPALTIAGHAVFGASPATINAPTGGTVVDAEARNAVSAVINALQACGVLAAT